jgi:hypothetical protein
MRGRGCFCCLSSMAWFRVQLHVVLHSRCPDSALWYATSELWPSAQLQGHHSQMMLFPGAKNIPAFAGQVDVS